MSAYRLLPRRKWDSIRNAIIEAHGHACAACAGKVEGLECNEIWEYKDGVASLAGFEMLCPQCHLAVHIGRAEKLGRLDEILRHLCKVNGIDMSAAIRMRNEAFREWKARNLQSWRVTVAEHLLSQFPDLACLQGNR